MGLLRSSRSPVAPAAGRGSRWRPYPFELLALLSFVLSWAALRSVGVQIGIESVKYTLWIGATRLLIGLAVGVVINVVYRLWPRGALRAYLREIATVAWFVDTVRILVACTILFHSFSWLKVLIPFVNGRIWDAELAWFDQAFHLGISPNRFFVALFEGTPVLTLIDWTYYSWVPFAVALFGFFATFPDVRTRARFTFSHVAIWTLGVWIYVAMPAVGPGLAFPEDWTGVHDSLPVTVSFQSTLLQNYDLVLKAKQTGLFGSLFNPAIGVAAMPSLHVGIDWLLLLWCRRRARRLLSFMVIAFVIHFLGSVVTGWHYAVDAYVGMAIAQLMDRETLLAHRLPWGEEPDPAPERTGA